MDVWICRLDFVKTKMPQPLRTYEFLASQYRFEYTYICVHTYAHPNTFLDNEHGTLMLLLLLRTIRWRFMWSRVIGPNNCVFCFLHDKRTLAVVRWWWWRRRRRLTTTTPTRTDNSCNYTTKIPRSLPCMYECCECALVCVCVRNVSWLSMRRYCHMLILTRSLFAQHLKFTLRINKP